MSVVVLLPHVVMMFRCCSACGRPGAVLTTAATLSCRRPCVSRWRHGAGADRAEICVANSDNALRYDLTDKGAGWVGWLLSAAAAGRAGFRASWARALVIMSTLVMLSICLIPHSLRGSQLDYEKLTSCSNGHRPGKAIGTSDK
jgi:hypothetical protein